MICKTCGMDSKTAGTCSWCGASLASPDDTPLEIKPERARPVIREEVEPLEPETEVAIGTVPSLSSLRTEAKPEGSAILPPASPTATPPKVTAARKMAPPLPSSGGKGRAPAPAVPPPSSRSASATGKLPPLSSLPNAPAATSPAPVRAPIASLQDQADAMFTPDGAQSAAAPALAAPLETPAASASPALQTAAAPAPVASLVDAPFMAPNPTVASAPSLTASSQTDTAIGSGITPAKTSSPAASAKPALTEQQKRAAVNAALAESMQSPTELLMRYLGVFAVILVVTGLLAHLMPRFYLIPMIVAMFVAALLLPIMRVTPWVEEDSEDVALFVGLTLLFGPLVALIIYGVVAAFRQSFNASIMGGLAVAALLRIVAEAGAGNVSGIGPLFAITSPFSGLQHADSGLGTIKLLLRNWTGFAALAGWYAASSFHKEDE